MRRFKSIKQAMTWSIKWAEVSIIRRAPQEGQNPLRLGTTRIEFLSNLGEKLGCIEQAESYLSALSAPVLHHNASPQRSGIS
ncbi:MAG: hypothetical protein ACI9ON_003761 [Limisphaerales bacterium]|jgi:hypothetical protein